MNRIPFISMIVPSAHEVFRRLDIVRWHINAELIYPNNVEREEYV
jgi:hypothetical protein